MGNGGSALCFVGISGHFQLILIVVMMMHSKILDEGRHIIPNTWFKNGSHHVFAYIVLMPFWSLTIKLWSNSSKELKVNSIRFQGLQISLNLCREDIGSKKVALMVLDLGRSWAVKTMTWECVGQERKAFRLLFVGKTWEYRVFWWNQSASNASDFHLWGLRASIHLWAELWHLGRMKCHKKSE